MSAMVLLYRSSATVPCLQMFRSFGITQKAYEQFLKPTLLVSQAKPSRKQAAGADEEQMPGFSSPCCARPVGGGGQDVAPLAAMLDRVTPCAPRLKQGLAPTALMAAAGGPLCASRGPVGSRHH